MEAVVCDDNSNNDSDDDMKMPTNIITVMITAIVTQIMIIGR